jgi:hypothetical protein
MGTTAGSPLGLVASSDGYLLTTSVADRGSTPILWFSADGVTWQETANPAAAGTQYGAAAGAQYGPVRTIGIPDGFYTTSSRGFGPSSAAFSVNGRVWADVEGGPEGHSMQLVQMGTALVAIDADPQSGAPRVWIGGFDRRGVAWHRESDADPAFAGAVVSALVSDGQRAYAFGWDRSSEEPLVWTRDSLGWTRTSLPDLFGGLPQLAAAGPSGVVVVGHRTTLRGDNPVVWHLTANRSWLPEPQPVFAAVPDPTVASCPSVPRNLPEFMVLDTAAALVCFGHAPITMRAWSARCDQCVGSPAGVAEPAWLMAPSLNQLFLSPIKPVSDGEWWTSMVLAPSVVPDPIANAGTWVQLTGHFDDPVAATCHYQPVLDELAYWSGQQPYRNGCRQVFVVTEVKVVSGP